MLALTRRDDWRSRLEAAIDAVKAVPADWAKQADCGPHLTGRAVEALTGVDVAAAFRGRYQSAAGALRVMKAAGFDNLGDLVASLLPEIHPSQAGVGDIAAIADDSPFGFALGVVDGERVFVMRPDGLGTVDLLAAQRAFKVG
ncbi:MULTISPECIES: hypothetical protein [unclassified Ensifer]|uniref:DUF6950 family protein n=1 Tax=unclassified Ensifer TaxID=2633371 RepID=UPI000812D87E|nr:MULTISPECIES: hypothetical protein [unclassified Ensifer]OCP17370.1 hypothetical protein BC361_07875 [Ensifer sp. LC54]OCP28725.1 hypothetical protein BC363_02485 [Ensifer sp. LC384]